MKRFICRICGAEFSSNARKAYYCKKCKVKAQAQAVRKCRLRKKNNELMRNHKGCGARGQSNVRYVDGKSTYRRDFDEQFEYKKCCAYCGRMPIIIHHFDGDRSNNDIDNLVPLCKSCHAKVHNVVRNFKKRT